MRKLLAILILLITLCATANAQGGKTGIIKGKLINSATKAPFVDIRITLPDLNIFTSSDGEGNFTVSEVPYGNQKVIIAGIGVTADTVMVNVSQDVNDLNTITLVPNDQSISAESVEIPTLAVEEDNSSTDADNSSSSQGGLVATTRDPFIATTSFVLGIYRFQNRGYNRAQQEVQINGIEMNDVETGDASWNRFGGLSDVFHGRNVVYGLTHSDYTYGGLIGSTYFDATAADQRKGARVTYSLANRNYRNRIMLTYNSGMMKSGWAYSLSATKRWANEGYRPGTFYDAYSFYGAVSKKLGKGTLNLTAFAAPTRWGKATYETNEMFDLTGSHFYNATWGFQNGEKRNSRVADLFQPQFILNYNYKPNQKTRWNTAIGYQFGKSKNSTLSGYNAADPRPDYYRNLPSYHYTDTPPDSVTGDLVRDDLKAHPEKLQLDWSRMYNANYTNFETINNVNGVAGNSVTGRRSLYVLSNYVDDIKKISFNSTIDHTINKYVEISGGISFVSQKTESYFELADLLGGDYFVNYNQFAARQYVGNTNYIQNNLNDPNQVIKKGDKYYYDYNIHFNNGLGWAQVVGTYNKFELFLAGNAGLNTFSREGLMKNGLFPNNSYGTSKTMSFFTYGVKGGITYKFDGRNSLFVNANLSGTPPTDRNTYISPQTRDFTINNPITQTNLGIEGGYLMQSPIVNARVVGYVTDVSNGSEIKRFYNDDPSYQTFVNYVLQNVSTRFIGTELALQVRVSNAFRVTGVASLGQAFYTNRPDVSVYLDNDTSRKVTSRQDYIKNYYLAVGPQSVYSLGLNYRSRKYWFANINANYLDRNYVDINPDRRTPQAVDLVTPNSAQWHKIMDQEKLPAAFTLDLSAGKSFLMQKLIKGLPRRDILYINIGVSNLLNNTNIKTGGFEQLRYDFAGGNPDKFANKYAYGFGINFFANISLKF